jgi:hypothetical protein
MCTVLVSYNPKNKAANNLMYALSKTRGVKIDEDAIFTDEELRRIDEARNSGYASLDDLKKLLKQ